MSSEYISYKNDYICKIHLKNLKNLEILQYLNSSGINIKGLLRFKSANMFSKENVFLENFCQSFFFTLKLCQRHDE